MHFPSNILPDIEGVTGFEQDHGLAVGAGCSESGVEFDGVGEFEDVVVCAHYLVGWGVLNAFAELEWAWVY